VKPQVQVDLTPSNQLNVPLNLIPISNMLQPLDQFVNSPSITANSTEDNIFDDSILLNPERIEKTSLDVKLCKWIVDFHVSYNCVNALLIILKSEGLDFPKDTRTLIKTSKANDHTIIPIHPGSYIHLGIEFMLSKFINANLDHFKNDQIQLGMNVDGLPLTSSSKSSLWPIFISFVNVQNLSQIVIPVGLYHGKYKKPTSSNDYLSMFVDEMKKTFYLMA